MQNYDPEHREQAKAQSLPMYKFELNRKYTLPNGKGGYSQSVGVLTKEEEPYAQLFKRVVFGLPPEFALTQLLATVGNDSGVSRIAKERQRQMTDEGYTNAQDGGYTHGQLAAGAAAYAQVARCLLAGNSLETASCLGLESWPFPPQSFKPSPDPIRNLEKSAAMAAAEIDRLLRIGK